MYNKFVNKDDDNNLYSTNYIFKDIINEIKKLIVHLNRHVKLDRELRPLSNVSSSGKKIKCNYVNLHLQSKCFNFVGDLTNFAHIKKCPVQSNTKRICT